MTGAAKEHPHDVARRVLFGMKVGTWLRKVDGTRWSLRALLPGDDRAVIRRWYSTMRRYYYEVISPIEIQVGIYKKDGKS